MTDLHDQLADTAAAYTAAGFSVVPAKADGSKAPFGRWRDYWQRRATETALRAMFATGQYDGLGIVCGAISGNAEMLELEGRAVREGLIESLRTNIAPRGHGDLLDRLAAGHLETTPGGGIHLLYRVDGEDVPGNLKLARRPSTPDELAAWKAQQWADLAADTAAAPVDDAAAVEQLKRRQDALERVVDGAQVPQVLIETRGEHGFTVAAPSGGRTHPSGRSWQLVAGGPGTVPTITAAERAALHDACRALDTMPTRENACTTTANTAGMSSCGAPSSGAATAGSDPTRSAGRPGDDYNDRATWAEILEPHGWHAAGRTRNGGVEWTRPGKDHGPSATTGVADDADRLYVFTSSTLFEPETPYSKFAAYALLEHGGRHDLAAAALRREGYGDPTPAPRGSDAFVGLVDTTGDTAWTTTTAQSTGPTATPKSSGYASTGPTSPTAAPSTTATPTPTSSSSSPESPTSTSTPGDASSTPSSSASSPPAVSASAAITTTATANAPAPADTALSTGSGDPAGSAIPTTTSGGEASAAPADTPRTSWWPRPLDAILAGQQDEPEPAYLARQDGHRLFYAGKVNGLIGESESGKTWVGLLAVLQALQVGETCLVLDFEDTAPGIVARLRLLGADDKHLRRLAYIGPDEQLHEGARDDLQAALTDLRPTVVLLDGVNAGMTLLGLDSNSTTDATAFAQRLLVPLSRTGACVITVDHVPKRTDERGKGGIGSQAKRAMTTGAAFRVEVVDEFGRGMTGRLKLTVDKDRPGHVRAHSTGAKDAGLFVIASRPDGTIRAHIDAPDQRTQREVEKQRADEKYGVIMEAVSHELEGAGEDGASQTVLEARVALRLPCGARREDVREAARRLVQARHAAVQNGPRGSLVYRSTRPYRRPAAADGSPFAGLV